jgi:hypothetical protein
MGNLLVLGNSSFFFFFFLSFLEKVLVLIQSYDNQISFLFFWRASNN